MVSYSVMYVLPTSEPTGISSKYHFCYLNYCNLHHSLNHVISVTTKPKKFTCLLRVNNVPCKHAGRKKDSTYQVRVNFLIL